MTSDLNKINTAHLRSLLNQAEADGKIPEEAVRIWLEYAKAALTGSTRVNVQLALNLLPKTENLPTLLAIYRELCLGKLASLENNREAMQQHYERGIAKLADEDLQQPQFIELKAILEINLANALSLSRKWHEAQALVEQALPVVQDNRMWETEAEAREILLRTYLDEGKIGQAHEMGQAALAAARQSKDRRVQAKVLQSVGTCYILQKKHSEGIAHLEEAMALYRAIGHAADLGILYTNLASAFAQLDRYREALSYHEMAHNLFKQRNDKLRASISLSNIGGCNAELGRIPEATAAYTEGLAFAREVNDPPSLLLLLARCSTHFAENHAASHAAKARAYVAEALEILAKHIEGLPKFRVVRAYTCFARTLVALGATPQDYADAMRYYETACQIYAELDDSSAVSELNKNIATTLFSQPEKWRGQSAVLDFLKIWWEEVRADPNAYSGQTANICRYAELLVQHNQAVAALDCYKAVFENINARLNRRETINPPLPNMANHLLNAVRLAPPALGAKILEEGWQWYKAGAIQLPNPKEYEALVKSARRKTL
jgi:tetratricopeptide (TPR) repeat protein